MKDRSDVDAQSWCLPCGGGRRGRGLGGGREYKVAGGAGGALTPPRSRGRAGWLRLGVGLSSERGRLVVWRRVGSEGGVSGRGWGGSQKLPASSRTLSLSSSVSTACAVRRRGRRSDVRWSHSKKMNPKNVAKRGKEYFLRSPPLSAASPPVMSSMGRGSREGRVTWPVACCLDSLVLLASRVARRCRYWSCSALGEES